MLLLANFLLFQGAWLACVAGAANGAPWLGPLAVGLVLTVHLAFARHRVEEILLAVSCAILGTLFDSLLVSFGWLEYASGQFNQYLAPYWITAMWALFATTLNVSLRWLRSKPIFAALLGLVGAPLAYVTGAQLGAVVLADAPAALAALAIGWSLMLPLLVGLATRLDGMPGPRPAWAAEYPR